MKSRVVLVIVSLCALFGMLLPLVTPAVAQDDASSRSAALTQLLNAVPDTNHTRMFLSYGDLDAWSTSWDVPRVDSVAELDGLPREPRAYWLYILPRQTLVSDWLGLRYILEEYRSFYGFDVFQVDRVIESGMPPALFMIVEHRADPEAVAAQLMDSGYTAQDVPGGWVLYSQWEDLELPPPDAGVPRGGRQGRMNRIALKDQRMMITPTTNSALSMIVALDDSLPLFADDPAYAPFAADLSTLVQGDTLPSLADDPAYSALVTALDDPLLDGTGPIVGAILQDRGAYPLDFMDWFRISNADREAMRESLGWTDPANLLPEFLTAGFITSHGTDATYLTLALTFPPGTDAQAAADLLAEKLMTYVSVKSNRPLAEEWTLHTSGVVMIDSMPVALVIMAVPDPVTTPDDERVNAYVLDWGRMVASLDLMFLATTSSAGE